MSKPEWQYDENGNDLYLSQYDDISFDLKIRETMDRHGLSYRSAMDRLVREFHEGQTRVNLAEARHYENKQQAHMNKHGIDENEIWRLTEDVKKKNPDMEFTQQYKIYENLLSAAYNNFDPIDIINKTSYDAEKLATFTLEPSNHKIKTGAH